MVQPHTDFGPEGLRAAIAAKTRASRPRDRRVRSLLRYAGLIGAFCSAVGLVVVLGWLMDVDRITTLGAGFASMKFTTALSFVGVGVSLVLIARDERGRFVPAVLVLVVLGGGFALVAILEYAADVRTGLDNPFGLDDSGDAMAGRMSLATAIGMALLWASLAAVVRSRIRLSQSLAAACLALGVMTLLGYAYSVDELYEFGPFSSTALHTALGLALAAAGVLLLRSGDGFMSLITGNTAGGIIVRQLAPLGVVVPVVAGALIGLGRPGVYSGAVALALFATFISVATTALIFYGGGRMRHLDLQRAGAEETLRLAQEAIEARDVMAAALGRAERRTREILDSAAEAYVATDAEGITLEWNQAAAEMFGWSREEILGRRAADLVISSVEEVRIRDVLGLDDEVEVPDGSVLGRRIPMVGRQRDGAKLDIEVTTWRLGSGATLTHHSLMNDVTARREAERDLQRAVDDLEDFSTAMAHDLKSPLTVVRGFAQLLESKIEDDELLPLIERIIRASDRGVDLIDDILAFRQVGAGRAEHTQVDLGRVVAEVADDESSRVDRSVSVEVGALPAVRGDEALLRQLFGNLIGNALKYVPLDRSPEVSLSADVDAEQGTLHIRVRDNGTPIDVADRESIFEMFRRGTNIEGRQGTGVGLAICRRVAELHRGSLHLEAGDEGNCFVVVLPLPPGGHGQTPARDALPSH